VVHKIVVFSKPGCHLCEEAIRTLEELLNSDSAFELEVVDITKDESTYEKYFLTIPVVQVDGEDVFDAKEIGYSSSQRYGKLKDLVANLR
jgi:glutaredoxin